jgi:hypothetical protein
VGTILADEPLPILEGIGLVAVSVGLILSSVARGRAQRPASRIAAVFWRDVSQAGFIWAGASIVVLIGAVAEIEGLRVPVWILVSTLVGLGCLAVARLRWMQHAGSERLLEDRSRPESVRLVSTSWEVALIAAAGGGLLVYGATLSHSWGHPIHWLIAGIAAAVGYAVGLVVATPRYTVRSTAHEPRGTART